MVKGEMRFFPEAMKTHFEATDGLNSCPTLQGAVFHNFSLQKSLQREEHFLSWIRGKCFVLEVCLWSVHVCAYVYLYW